MSEPSCEELCSQCAHLCCRRFDDLLHDACFVQMLGIVALLGYGLMPWKWKLAWFFFAILLTLLSVCYVRPRRYVEPMHDSAVAADPQVSSHLLYESKWPNCAHGSVAQADEDEPSSAQDTENSPMDPVQRV